MSIINADDPSTAIKNYIQHTNPQSGMYRLIYNEKEPTVQTFKVISQGGNRYSIQEYDPEPLFNKKTQKGGRYFNWIQPTSSGSFIPLIFPRFIPINTMGLYSYASKPAEKKTLDVVALFQANKYKVLPSDDKNSGQLKIQNFLQNWFKDSNIENLKITKFNIDSTKEIIELELEYTKIYFSKPDFSRNNNDSKFDLFKSIFDRMKNNGDLV